MGLESLELKLSGGAANADPALSTGGDKSATAVLFQTATTLTPISGVSIVDASGNAAGVGTLAYAFADKTLTWTPPGDTIGAPVSIGTAGRYIVRGGNQTSGYLLIDSTPGLLSAVANASASITVADRSALFLPSVSKDTALAGAVEYYLFYLDNTGATTLKQCAIALQSDTPGADTLSIAAVATKNTIELLAAASAHTYAGVGVEVPLGDLLAGDYWGVWVKRDIPAGITSGVPTNPFRMLITSLT